jgi:uroporphyrinogen decarboxylase
MIKRLCDYLGEPNLEALLDRLDIDRRQVKPRYTGPELKHFDDGSYEINTSGGPIQKKIEINETMSTEATVKYPWAHVEKVEDLEGLVGWDGKIEWWDFSVIKDQVDALEAKGEYWIAAHGDPSGLQHLQMWVGDEKFMMDLILNEDLALAMIEKHNEFRLEHALKTLEAGGGRIHELHGGGDYATQTGLQISRDMFQKFFAPLYRDFYSEIRKNFDVEIFFHCCGAVRELIPDLIDLGVTILDPIQTTAAGMGMNELKDNFGDKLTFHGAIDIQDLLPNGSIDEVRAFVTRAISILGKDGGYILGPTHTLQQDTPLENIVAMYETAQQRSIK